MSRARAGTLRVSTERVRITSETVKEHKDAFGKVIFRELVAFELEELWPGAFQGESVSYEEEP